MPLGCSHAQSRVKLILIASTSKINISGHPTGASGIEFHYKGPDISYLLNTEEERKLIRILGQKRKMRLGFSPMVLCVVQRLCASTFFRSYRTLHLLLISKAEISHEHCERTVVFLEPLSFCQFSGVSGRVA